MPTEDIHIIHYESEQYPPLLREITDPPQQLYIRGSVELLQHNPLLAVVGSRKASHYGKYCLEQLLPPLFPTVSVVSGLAFGIDALAARVSVTHKQPTIAVLGSGVDAYSIYPRMHLGLSETIIRMGGALVSEYPPGTPVYKSHFPERNRIIAGLAKATLIAQAAERSGSLITARLALESNRDVCAIPGAINDPLSLGTNRLIREGATPIVEPDDLLRVMGLEPEDVAENVMAELSTEQTSIVNVLSVQPLHIDEIIVKTSLSPALVAAHLSQLELLDVATHIGGMKYIRK